MTSRNARTRRAQATISLDQPPEVGLPSVARATGLSHPHLHDAGAPTPEERSISRQTRTHRAQQIAIAIKISQAQHLAQTLTENTARCYAQFQAGQRTLLDQDRHPQDQANLERFCATLEQDFAGGQRALVYGGVDALCERALAPVTPDDRLEEVEVVTEVPEWVAKFFGKEKVRVNK